MAIRLVAPLAPVLIVLLSALPALGGGSGVGSFQLMTHQKCYKVKDSSKIKAVVDLYTVHSEFEIDCKIKKADMICLPAAKDVLEATRDKVPVPFDPLNDGRGTDDFFTTEATTICYKVKCPKQELNDLSLVDQFGDHDFDLKKAALVCAPASRRCDDPTRTILVAGGPGVTSCREFDGDSTGCNTAWKSKGSGKPVSCFYTAGGECHGCAGGDGASRAEGCTNTCLASSCTNPSLTLVPGGQSCAALDNQPACDSSYSPGGFGVHSCGWDGFVCRGCGPAGEISGACTNSCR